MAYTSGMMATLSQAALSSLSYLGAELATGFHNDGNYSVTTGGNVSQDFWAGSPAYQSESVIAMDPDWIGASRRALENINPHQLGVSTEPAEAPVATAVTEPGCDEEYLALASKLGIKGASVSKARLLKFLHEQCMGTYPLDKVDTYMRHLAGSGRYWCWRPLREQDQSKVASNSSRYAGRHGDVMAGLYPHEIPYAALLTVQKITDAFPTALIFVSDYCSARPDPFLGLTTKEIYEHDQTMIVVERWDEPSFRG